MNSFCIAIVTIMVGSTSFAKAPSVPTKTAKAVVKSAQKRAIANVYFQEAKAQIAEVLSQPVFENYKEYTIDNIRQGEIGETQAFFVRLVKPLSDSSGGVCLVFLGSSQLQSAPHDCSAAE